MTIADNRRIPKGTARNLVSDSIRLTEKLTFSSSGAITAGYGVRYSGMTFTITASKDGRYDIAFFSKYRRFLGMTATLVGPADDDIVATAGAFCSLRSLDLAAGTAQLQMSDLTDGTDRDATSGNVLYITLEFEIGVSNA